MTKIKLSTDIGAAFDILSILLVKSQKSPTQQNIDNYINCATEIRQELTDDVFNKVCSSDLFRELKEVNNLMFDTVELAKKDEILASKVDSVNYQRYLKKSNLQKEFFGGELSEQKIGYE